MPMVPPCSAIKFATDRKAETGTRFVTSWLVTQFGILDEELGAIAFDDAGSFVDDLTQNRLILVTGSHQHLLA